MYPTTPMPGENMEKNESKENGEINNPYYSEGFEKLGDENDTKDNEELIEQFESLAEEVPFAGETSNKQYDTDNAVGQQFDSEWQKGSVDLENIKDSTDANYIDGATEQAASDLSTKADIANTNRDVNNPDFTDNNPHDAAQATAIQAIAASKKAEEAAEKIKAGDEIAMGDISNIEQAAAEAVATAANIPSAIRNDDGSNAENQMAINTAEQAATMATDAINTVVEAKGEYESLTEEDKELTKQAAELAETNGSDVETELEKLKKEKEQEEAPVLDEGMLGYN